MHLLKIYDRERIWKEREGKEEKKKMEERERLDEAESSDGGSENFERKRRNLWRWRKGGEWKEEEEREGEKRP